MEIVSKAEDTLRKELEENVIKDNLSILNAYDFENKEGGQE